MFLCHLASNQTKRIDFENIIIGEQQLTLLINGTHKTHTNRCVAYHLGICQIVPMDMLFTRQTATRLLATTSAGFPIIPEQ